MKKIIFYCCMLVSMVMADFKSISTEKLEEFSTLEGVEKYVQIIALKD